MIDAKALQVRAGEKVLLRDVALTFGSGERVALVGHNGAGKSTLLRAITGFCTVSRGSLRVLGTEMAGLTAVGALRRVRCRIAQVHQGLHLVGRMSVIDNVLVGGAGRNPSARTWVRSWPESERTAANAALARVDMAWAVGRRTDSLSGGERQKVAIARALHQDAPILLADEPTASLDARAAHEVIDMLAAIASERGSTLVCVVHDLDLVPRVASRAIALRRGSVVLDTAVTAHTPARLREVLK